MFGVRIEQGISPCRVEIIHSKDIGCGSSFQSSEYQVGVSIME